MASSFVFRRAPFNLLYLLSTVATLLVKLPGWMVLLILRSARQKASWSYKRALLVSIFQHVSSALNKIGPIKASPDFRSIAKSAVATGIWCEPKPELIAGHVKKWAEAAKVKTIRVPGYWYNSPRTKLVAGTRAQPNEKVFYHFHAGAYIMETAHPNGISTPVIMGLLAKTKTVNRLFSLEYRLSSSAPLPIANPFPAALIDAVTGYNYLISELGFEPNNVIVVADSAGGHLALCFLRYLVETSVLPVPGAFIGLSPLCDITSSHLAVHDPSFVFGTDVVGRLDKGLLEWAWKSFAGPLYDDPNDGPTKNPYLSPASISPDIESTISFKDFPETFLVSGGAERIRDAVRTLKQRLVHDLGEGKVTAYEAPDGVHDFLAFTWHEPERTEVLGLLSSWVDRK
ncbi:alpha/beta-hydrolase [Thelephora ganbajun]|uniref:Alpha/beta-hydrolase n=1 Tax=Thelephora ganbajun TaxID=370292 RepID=A0ACB6Z5K1_THEGA|nr:alpha/beta-hydrolase [Thelephora ganbajun]